MQESVGRAEQEIPMNNPFPGIVPSRDFERVHPLSLENVIVCHHCCGTGQLPMTGRDIPLSRTAHGKYRYPLRSMKVGERFFVPNNGRSTEQTQNAVTSSVGSVQRTTKLRFTQRRYAMGVRVWRVS